MRPRVARFLAVLAVAAVSACSIVDPGGMFRSSLSTQPGVVDTREAASLISAYRRQHGLGGVTVDPTLTGHNRNLLLREATEIGIAVAVAPESRYKTFWTLILAAPQGGGAVAAMPGPGPLLTAVGASADLN
jgi:hypothetical protein